MSKHAVYIVRCRDGSLYTGYAVDVEKRVATHNTGQGAKYTRSRLPVVLAYTETFETKSDALKREYAIKQLTRAKKEQLIQGGTS
ncbi:MULTISPECIES: GIY-YIG nuclease family protein [unclassified Exiguobacterium]|uniref:GIY-YIG nuclease family protein n=1 Tax=unclassified Exiguobacterium TaxID=2644629 RepID=UPI001BEBDAF0|nr:MULTISPECIES: GIY-YIG nuclease family protein [unclassified Exiguobacterium]